MDKGKYGRVRETMRYLRMMGFEDAELGRGRRNFQKFSLLKKCHLRESNCTGDTVRTKENLLKKQRVQYQGGIPVFEQFSLLKRVPFKESNSTGDSEKYAVNY